MRAFLLSLFHTIQQAHNPTNKPANKRIGQCSKNFKNKFYTPEPTDKSRNNTTFASLPPELIIVECLD